MFRQGKVFVQSVLEREEQVNFSFDNTEKVKSLKQSIADRYNYSVDRFSLFFEYDWLNEDDYLCQYDIHDGREIKYVLFDK